MIFACAAATQRSSCAEKQSERYKAGNVTQALGETKAARRRSAYSNDKPEHQNLRRRILGDYVRQSNCPRHRLDRNAREVDLQRIVWTSITFERQATPSYSTACSRSMKHDGSVVHMWFLNMTQKCVDDCQDLLDIESLDLSVANPGIRNGPCWATNEAKRSKVQLLRLHEATDYLDGYWSL